MLSGEAAKMITNVIFRGHCLCSLG